MFIEKPRSACQAGARRLIMAALAMLLSSAATQAASVVIDPAGMNAIFSQSNFGSTPISIRFNAPKVIVDPALLDIKTLADLKALYALAPDPAPTVDAFFVNQLDACGTVELTVNGLFAGCAQLPGHIFVEESSAAELSTAPLMGHELGHNLNLQHNLFSSNDLMWPLFPPGTELTAQEVATILQSPLVQTDSTGHKFIVITPIAIVAAPEPSTLLLLGVALGALLIIHTKKSRAGSAS